jgi:putative membrane-bound dehydrogenase-like protein
MGFRLASLLVFALAASQFPPPHNSERETSAPMPAAEAAAKFKVPPGFRVSVFAAEPDVQNPIACCWDPRGRLWVAENYTFAERPMRFDLNLFDRILIFEDQGIGKPPKRTVFADNLQVLTSIEVGHGGVWALCPPRLLFIPTKDDKPTGPPQVVLDGFTVAQENYHNFANGLKWGPDGWLYGRCGASCPGRLGVPGTPDAQRVPIHGGIWRYHPRRKVVEVLCHGTTNPWGHDWDERGECFFTNTVNGHLWHMIPGAHYARPHTIDPNPYVYHLIDQHADHYHWDNSRPWEDSRKADGEHDRRGGGHAHVGAMIYQGDQWPKEYRGKLFTLNLHGRRVNVDRLERRGSGFVGRHDADMLFAGDPFFRGMELTYGPDESVFILDWSDTGECHENSGVHRTSGRIYRVTHGDVRPTTASLLASLQFSGSKDPFRASAWHWRASIQHDMARTYRDEPGFGKRVIEWVLDGAPTDSAKQSETYLRMMWGFMEAGNRNDVWAPKSLDLRNEVLRCWAIRALADFEPIDIIDGPVIKSNGAWNDDHLHKLIGLAKGDESGLVRLTLASTMQRWPVTCRADLASALVAHKQDAADHNLPLLVWYGLIPVAELHPEHLVKVAAVCEWPMTRRCIARRLAEDVERRPEPLNELLKVSATKPRDFVADILLGMTEGLRGWQRAPKPAAWDSLAGQFADLPAVRELSVLFGDGRALDDVRRLALDAKADLANRRAALTTLIAARPPDLRAVCEQLLAVQFLNATAAKGLARFDDPAAAQAIVKNYARFHPSERPAVIDVLVSRPPFARRLLDAVGEGKIPKADLGAAHARQIAAFNDAALTSRLAAVWGNTRQTPADKRALMDQLRRRLTRDELAKADLPAGQAVFEKSCASCHKLFGTGGAIGPELTGANRDNLDYLLENIVDPSAVLAADFRMTRFQLADGRTITGVVKTRTPQAVTVQLEKEQVTIRRADIEAETPTEQSLMPDGLLTPLTPDEVRNLFAYLMAPVPPKRAGPGQ